MNEYNKKTSPLSMRVTKEEKEMLDFIRANSDYKFSDIVRESLYEIYNDLKIGKDRLRFEEIEFLENNLNKEDKSRFRLEVRHIISNMSELLKESKEDIKAYYDGESMILVENFATKPIT